MPGEDSPPPFAVHFRSTAPVRLEVRLYEQTLELTAHVHAMVEQLEQARFRLRDQLDRHATAVALSCGRALAEPVPSERRRLYRAARPRAVECATIMDILGRRAPQPPAVRALIADIIAKLEELARR